VDTIHVRIRALFLIASFSVSFLACATAQDDQEVPFKGHDAGHDVVANPDGGGDDTYVTPGTDSGRVTDSGVASDTYVPPADTGTYFDTYVPPPDDTGTAFDTYVPPPTDTGTGGYTCMYCSSGSCPDPLTEEACFLDCFYAGYLDCTMSGTKCTCI
jgi:hypothetical protein